MCQTTTGNVATPPTMARAFGGALYGRRQASQSKALQPGFGQSPTSDIDLTRVIGSVPPPANVDERPVCESSRGLAQLAQQSFNGCLRWMLSAGDSVPRCDEPQIDAISERPCAPRRRTHVSRTFCARQVRENCTRPRHDQFEGLQPLCRRVTQGFSEVHARPVRT